MHARAGTLLFAATLAACDADPKPGAPSAVPPPDHHEAALAAQATSATFHLVAPGDTLDDIARARYGSRHYAELIAAVNDVQPERVTVGMRLVLPTVEALVSPLARRVGEGSAALLRAQEAWCAVRSTLWEEHRAHTHARHPEVSRAATDADGARAAFSAAGAPTTQLTGLARALSAVGSGAVDPEGYAIDDVDRRFALAMAALLRWAR